MTDEDVRLAVYRTFADTGRAPTVAELVANGYRDAAAALPRLAAQRHVVLGADGEIVLAHPFSAIPMGFSVMGRRRLWWGGCAWDSFALPHFVPHEPRVLVATACPGCDAPLAMFVDQTAPPTHDAVAHFLVPAARMWQDVVHTCGHQRLFCGEPCIDAWLARTGHAKGYVLDLATLWRLAAHWYDGRLDRGYLRREPAQAAEYFRSVGLVGPFWS